MGGENRQLSVRHRLTARRRHLPPFGIRLASLADNFSQPVRLSPDGAGHTEDDRMSRRSSGRSFVGLILEIGLIVVVVALLPKLNLRPQPAAGNSPPVAQLPPE